MNKITEKRKQFISWTVISYIVALHFVLIFLVIKTDFIERAKGKLGISVVLNDHVKNMLLYHQSMDSSVPAKSVIFLGDSITQGLATAAVAPYAINYGIGGENTEQLLYAIPTYKSLDRASAIFLLIGINDFNQGREKGIIERLVKIDAALPTGKTVIWNSIMPAEKIGYSEILQVNKAIKQLCEKRKNCIFLDTSSFLFDANGKMIKALFSDGLHLNTDGYKQWISALRQTLQQAQLN